MSADENLEQRKLALHKVLDGLLDSFLDLKLAVNLAKNDDDIIRLWEHLKTKFVIDEKEKATKEDAPSEPSEQEGEATSEATDAAA